MSRAYEEGYAAYESKEDCPYRKESKRFSEWWNGYKDAEQDDLILYSLDEEIGVNKQ